jgi:hypothetical protein
VNFLKLLRREQEKTLGKEFFAENYFFTLGEELFAESPRIGSRQRVLLSAKAPFP